MVKGNGRSDKEPRELRCCFDIGKLQIGCAARAFTPDPGMARVAKGKHDGNVVAMNVSYQE